MPSRPSSAVNRREARQCRHTIRRYWKYLTAGPARLKMHKDILYRDFLYRDSLYQGPDQVPRVREGVLP